MKKLLSLRLPAPVSAVPVGSSDFLVLAHNRVFSRGHERFDADNSGAYWATWEELFGEWSTDAHVVQYVDPGQEPARLSRQSLATAPEGYFETLSYPLLALDLDNPGHVYWPDDPNTVTGALRDLQLRCGTLTNPPTGIYLTRGGARLVWALTEPTDFATAMGIQAALADEVQKLGMPLEVDAACLGQWSRLFRLPKVVRDGAPTWDKPYAHQAYRSGPWLDAATARRLPVVRGPRVSTSFRSGQVDAPLPDAQEARALVYRDGDPDQGRTKLGERLRSRLVMQVQRSGDWLDRGGRFQLHAIINSRRAVTENRNVTLMQGMSWLSAVLSDVPGCTAESIYGYIEPTLAATDAETSAPDPVSDRGATSWAEYAWGWLYTRWTGDQSSIALEREEQAKVETESAHVRASNLAELADWLLALWPLPPEAMKRNPEAWLTKHLVIQAARESRTWVLNAETGGYIERSAGEIPLATMMQHLGWTDYVPLFFEKDGTTVIRRDQDILQNYADVIEAVENDYSENSLVYCQDHPLGTGLRLFEPAFYPNPKLKPVYHPGVDKFLAELVGDELEGEKLRAILAHLPDIRGTKMPMVILSGISGTGKSMLLKGIQHLWHKRGQPVPIADVMGIADNFNEMLTNTPLVALDETSTDNLARNEVRQIFDKLKSLVSGSSIVLKRRYVDATTVSRNFRVVICSNDLGIANAIATSGSRDVDLRSIESQLLRMEAFFVPSRELPLLRERTKGWVDEGHIANHIVWLSQQPAARWAQVVETGKAHDDILRVGAVGVRQLRSRFGSEGLPEGSDDDVLAALEIEHANGIHWDPEDERCCIVLRALNACAQQVDTTRMAFASRGRVVLKATAFDAALKAIYGESFAGKIFGRGSVVSTRYIPLAKSVSRRPSDPRVAERLASVYRPHLELDDCKKWIGAWRQVANLEGAIEAAEQYGGCEAFVLLGRQAQDTAHL